LIFVDETGFEVISRTSYGRAESGDRAEINAPGVAGITTTCISLVSTKHIFRLIFF